MDIGKPGKKITVEPVIDPVPLPVPDEPQPAREPVEPIPEKQPEKV